MNQNPLEQAMQRAVQLHQSGNLPQAEMMYREILKRNPKFVPAIMNLGALLRQRGHNIDAIGLYKHALTYEPRNASLLSNMGNALQQIGLVEEAIQALKSAIECDPNFDMSYDNLGHTYSHLNRYDEAREILEKAVKINPNNANAWNNLAGVHLAQCRIEESIQCYRKAVEIRPDFAMARSNILFGMNFSPNCTAEQMYEEHLKWDEHHGKPLTDQIRSHPPRDVNKKRLRVGFISPDYKDHPVGRFLAPIFRVRNPDDWETFLYSDVLVPDHHTDWFRRHSDMWRETIGLTDPELAQLIRRDGIDILIDLAGHTGKNRLLMMARKPAPIQASWIGYFNTTGLSAMDYIIADQTCIPEEHRCLYTENIVQMPDGFLCYDPPKMAPQVNKLPALERGYVTFCSFNQLAKVSDAAIEAWGDLMSRIPTSRIVLRGKAFNDNSVRDRFSQKLAKVGIAAERFDLLPKVSMREYLATYNEVDIALDSFPFVGGTTTCDSLWMGVPVVTFLGDRFCGRHSASHIRNVGLHQLIGSDLESYLDIAENLAKDLDRLAEIRRGLRDMCKNSPLIDAQRFYHNFTVALKQMWTHNI